MWQTETSIEIAAPAQAVYDYLADLRRHKEWSRGVAEIEQTRGSAIEVGAEFKAEEQVPVKFTSYCRITCLEPPNLIEWSAWDGRTFHVDWSFEITENGSTTELIQKAKVQPTSLVGRVMLLALRKRQIPKENAESLARLKAVLEG